MPEHVLRCRSFVWIALVSFALFIFIDDLFMIGALFLIDTLFIASIFSVIAWSLVVVFSSLVLIYSLSRSVCLAVEIRFSILQDRRVLRIASYKFCSYTSEERVSVTRRDLVQSA